MSEKNREDLMTVLEFLRCIRQSHLSVARDTPAVVRCDRQQAD